MFYLYFRAIVTFLICFAQVVTVAVAAGYIPALWMIARKKRLGLLVYWMVLWLIFVAVAGYGLPEAMREWRAYLEEIPGRFKPEPMYLGYGLGVLGACFFFPEPMRIARNHLREDPRDRNRWQDDDGQEYKRKRRRKRRRTNHYDV